MDLELSFMACNPFACSNNTLIPLLNLNVKDQKPFMPPIAPDMFLPKNITVGKANVTSEGTFDYILPAPFDLTKVYEEKDLSVTLSGLKDWMTF